MDQNAAERKVVPSTELTNAQDTSRVSQPSVSIPTSSTTTSTSSSPQPRAKPRPLLPKPKSPPKPTERTLTIATTSKSPLTPARNRLSGCFVPICRIPKCSLRTHHQFNTPTLSHQSSDSTTSSTTDLIKTPSTPTSNLSVLGRGVDGLPALPLDGLEEPQLRHLFHRFYTQDYPRIDALIRPPALTEPEKLRTQGLKEISLKLALSEPAYSLNVIASAHLQVLTSRDYSVRDKLFAQLHGKVLSHLREKLNTFTEVDNLVPLIFTVIQFDLVLGNTSMFEGHRRALDHLVSSRGGAYNLGRSLALLTNLDRVMSICTGKRPLFVQMVDRSLVNANIRPTVYGGALGTRLKKASDNDVDASVVDVCTDICVAIEILEGEKWAFNLGDKIPAVNTRKIHYFYFLKDLINNAFAHLQSWDFSATRKSRPVLLAANLVSYMTLQDCYIVPLAVFLADRLKETLELRDMRREWSGCEDVIRWLLCVLLSFPKQWTGREWVVKEYVGVLSRLYEDKSWPADWIAVETRNARQFVWSDTRLGEHLASALRNIKRERQKA